MSDLKNILICGIGAIGSIYAEKFQRFCPDNLKILVDEKRLERYRNQRLVFNDKELAFNYVLPSNDDFKADLIIIATKNDGLIEAVNNIENFVKEDTIILSLLNGVTSEEIIAEKYGWDRILFSYFIGHSAIRTGRSVFHDDVNNIVFGSVEGITQNVKKVKDLFDKVEIKHQIPLDIKYSLWLKYMLNVSTNQPSALFRMTFGDMQQNEKLVDFAVSIMKEVQSVAKAEGVHNTENLIEDALKAFSTMSAWGKTSMLQDIEAGRKTEADIFAGTMVELGKKHSIQTPYNQTIKELFDVIHLEQDLKKTLLIQASV